MKNDRFLQSGTVIANRYEIIKCLGAGSMGLVYACKDRELAGRIIAMKVLFPEVAQDAVAAQRFRNEVNAAYTVSHPNVVRAYEFFKDGDIVAYTMEYVGGGDLASKLNNGKMMPLPEALSILSQMCLGVQAIHDVQIIHRDLKPENIMLTTDGVVKIADFGIARLGHGPKLTEHGGVVGTIDYVSPEYMLNSQVDWRSDIYAIGILAYEMVAGQPPYRGDSVYATMTKRLKYDPDPITKYRPDCPPALEKIILKAMSREPSTRFQSAYEMYEALQEIGGFEVYSQHHAHVTTDNHKNDLADYVERHDDASVEAEMESTGYGEDYSNSQDGLAAASGAWIDDGEERGTSVSIPSPSGIIDSYMPPSYDSGSDGMVSVVAGQVEAGNTAVEQFEEIEIASQYYLPKNGNGKVSGSTNWNHSGLELDVSLDPRNNEFERSIMTSGERLIPTYKRMSAERKKKESFGNVFLKAFLTLLAVICGVGVTYYYYVNFHLPQQSEAISIEKSSG